MNTLTRLLIAAFFILSAAPAFKHYQMTKRTTQEAA